MPEVVVLARPVRFGLFLNFGEFPGMSHAEVFERALHEAALAEELGLHDVWVTEHHFIPFGVNPSALAAAAFILGRTNRIRVGTAVTLAPLYHPIHLAEQAAVLDQLSGGRFDFGIGRGGYLRDFEVFGIDTARWDTEVAATMRVLLDAWSGEVAAQGPHVAFAPVRITPETRTKPHPPLFVASASPETLDLAAVRGIPLMHYFAAPLQARLKVESAYTERVARSGWSQPFPEHIHTLICAVTDDERATRQRLNDNLDYSYSTGDWPHVPQRGEGHGRSGGEPQDSSALAGKSADAAIVGNPAEVTAALKDYVAATGASRIVLFMEPIVDGELLDESIRRFASEVVPAFW